ncbi:MAG: hypothetical protein ACRD3V_06085 [Vicinamibacteria bacterium]
MWQKLLRESSFFVLLVAFDRDLAEEYRRKGCGCGGSLHRSAYSRKPRGGPPGLPEDYAIRESYCCGEEGCRRRLTPPSLRFLGRRVYLGAVVVLVSAMVNGVTAKRASSMGELCGVSVRTLRRWQKWWREQFVLTRVWRGLRGRFALRVDESLLPASLLEQIGSRGESERVVRMLRLLLPLTAGANCVVDY